MREAKFTKNDREHFFLNPFLVFVISSRFFDNNNSLINHPLLQAVHTTLREDFEGAAGSDDKRDGSAGLKVKNN